MAQSGRWRLLGVLLAAALVVGACGEDEEAATGGGTATGGDQKEVTIGFVGAKTGPNANLGLNIRDGVELAVAEANAEGGDVKIVLKEFDTAGDSAQAATIKDQFIGDTSIVGIVGPAFSGETKALIPDLQAAGVVMISPSATNKDLPTVVPDATVFHRIIADDALQATGVAKFLADEKPRSVSYVHDNSEYGKPLTADVEKLAAAAGLKTAAVETLDPKAQDFSATVNKVIASKADAVFYGGYYAEAGRLKKQLSDAGFKGTFISGDGALDPGFIESAGAAGAEGARLSCPCNLALEQSTGKLKEFYDNHKKQIGREPGLYSPEGYDAAKILIQGIRAGNDTREKLLRYVEDEVGTYEGISKTIEFEENGNLRSKTFFVFQVKGGKIVPLRQIEAEGAGGETTETTETTAATSSTT